MDSQIEIGENWEIVSAFNDVNVGDELLFRVRSRNEASDRFFLSEWGDVEDFQMNFTIKIKVKFNSVNTSFDPKRFKQFYWWRKVTD